MTNKEAIQIGRLMAVKTPLEVARMALAFDSLRYAVESAPQPPDHKDLTDAEREWTDWWDGPYRRAVKVLKGLR